MKLAEEVLSLFESATLVYTDVLTIDPDASDSYNDEAIRKQIIKEIKPFNLSFLKFKVLGTEGEDGAEVEISIKGDPDKLKKFVNKYAGMDNVKNPEVLK